MAAIIIWLVFSLIVGAIGDNRTIGFWTSFLLSVILSPLIGLIIVLFYKTNNQAAIEQGLLDKLSESNKQKPEEIEIKLKKIQEMKDSKLITESEYTLMRKEIMAK